MLSDLSVSRVATKVEYDNYSNFTRIFKNNAAQPSLPGWHNL